MGTWLRPAASFLVGHVAAADGEIFVGGHVAAAGEGKGESLKGDANFVLKFEHDLCLGAGDVGLGTVEVCLGAVASAEFSVDELYEGVGAECVLDSCLNPKPPVLTVDVAVL